MKYPYVALASAMLFGAGCSLPFASPPATPRAPAPIAVPAVPPEKVTGSAASSAATSTATSSADLVSQYEKDHAAQTKHRRLYGLSPGRYFVTEVPGSDVEPKASAKLVHSSEDGSFQVVEQDVLEMTETGLVGGSSNLFTLVLEPEAPAELYFITPNDRWSSIVWSYGLKTGKRELRGNWPNAMRVSPNERAALYIGDTDVPCAYISPSMDVSGSRTDYGRSLCLVDLATGKATGFGVLPKGYSYARELTAPNPAVDSFNSVGDVYWVDASTLEARVYPDTESLAYPVTKPRTAIKTIRVKVGQAKADVTKGMALKTYTDSTYGVRVTYPASAVFAKTDITTQEGSVPGSKRLFSITEKGNEHIYSPLIASVWRGRDAETDCYATSTLGGPLTEVVTINGADFRMGYWSDAGAGGLWEGPIYRTFKDGICYSLGYTIETHSDGSPEYEKIRKDAQRDIPQFFDPIIKSIEYME